MIEALEKQGVLDDTIIMFMSDNGSCAEDRAKVYIKGGGRCTADCRRIDKRLQGALGECKTPLRIGNIKARALMEE